MSQCASRSWADAITNEVLLEGVDSLAYINWLRNRDVRVEDAIPQFLHEYTHHWCFNSMVGRAIALVRMRSRYALLFRHDENVAVDLATYETARRMLQPFSEGLALFAEFDLAPDDSAIEATTILALKMCFGFPLNSENGKPNIELATDILLQNTRMRSSFIEQRKVPLYAKDFDVDGDGYLAGYLAIKNLWSVFARNVGLSRNLFISYVRVYLYEDPLLATLLVAPTTGNEILASEAVARRIQERFDSLIVTLQTSPEKPGTFAELVDSGQHSTAWLAATDCSDRDFAHTQDVFNQCVNEFSCDVPPDDENAMFVANLCRFYTIERSQMVVASESVKLLCNGQAWQAVLATGESIPLAQAKGLRETDDAIYAVVLAQSGNSLFEGVLANGIWVEQRRHGLTDDTSAGVVSLMMNNRKVTRDVFDLMNQKADELVGQSWLQIIMDQVRLNVAKWSLDLYLSLSTLIVSDDHLAEVKSLIRDRGIRPFVGSRRHARVMAAVSLGNTVFNQPAGLIKLWGRLAGLKFEEMEAAIADLRKQELYPLLVGDEFGLYATV